MSNLKNSIRGIYHQAVPLSTRLKLRDFRLRILGKSLYIEIASSEEKDNFHLNNPLEAQSQTEVLTTFPLPTVAGPNFQAAVKERYQKQNISPDHPMYETWFNYTMQTNERGAEAVRVISSYMDIAGKRHLDIGCAYAGTVVAFAHAGASSIGIELSRYLLELGKINVSDYPRLSVKLLEGDILNPSIYEGLGTFDIITCENVIEHVESVKVFLDTLATLLKEEGVCHLNIPNPFSYGEVLKDGHYGLFGLTLLDRPRAVDYFRSSGNKGDYGVGEYCYSFEDYLSLFHSVKIELELLNPPLASESIINDLSRSISGLQPEFDSTVAKGMIPEDLQADVHAALNRYLNSFEYNYQRYLQSTGEYRHLLGHRLLRKYSQEGWSVIAFKSLS
ncbi:MAG: methyltransferase domain-containing protein [Pleurocapsa minor GSE-CHR-MK-17-07R]|jgi:2-polyprenyl-3-methyl-5-hydroxy-6-metoxy-1,4-benzoquinol methylase|nr:methyltransferase domain-containing protein [Pleurocapsa minor GSE-CHR-MK 17-07R]